MIIGRHVYYTGLCTGCGSRRYVRRSDGRIGRHSPTPYPRGDCRGADASPIRDSLCCRECKERVEDGRITHKTTCVYMEGVTHEVPPHILSASRRTSRVAADSLPEGELTSAANEGTKRP